MTTDIVQYNTETVPSWVSVDAITGLLIVNMPDITSTTQYKFYVRVIASNDEDEFFKLITLKVIATTDGTEEETTTISEEQLETTPEGKLTM